MADILAELARVKALFQARAIATIIGATPPTSLTPHQQAAKTRAERRIKRNLAHCAELRASMSGEAAHAR